MQALPKSIWGQRAAPLLPPLEAASADISHAACGPLSAAAGLAAARQAADSPGESPSHQAQAADLSWQAAVAVDVDAAAKAAGRRQDDGPGLPDRQPDDGVLPFSFDPLSLFKGTGAPVRLPEQLEEQLLATSVRYALIGAASNSGLSDLLQQHGDGSAAMSFAASLAVGCAAGVASRAIVGGALELGRAAAERAPPSEAAKRTAGAAKAAGASCLGLGGGSAGAAAGAVAVARYLSRASNAAALQMLAFAGITQATAGAGLPEQQRLLLAGALAGAIAVACASPVDAAVRKPLVAAARKAEAVLPWRAAAIVAAADVAAVLVLECAALSMGMDPVFCV